MGPDQVDVCVSAVPRDGESNLAVERVFAEVSFSFLLMLRSVFVIMFTFFFFPLLICWLSRSSTSPNQTWKSSGA